MKLKFRDPDYDLYTQQSPQQIELTHEVIFKWCKDVSVNGLILQLW